VNLLIVEIENLTKIYESKLRVVALDGIGLELEQGEIFGLLNPNGAGKTKASNTRNTVFVACCRRLASLFPRTKSIE
jgi:ABC-type Na+ transport system ATPase subunit NatA